MKTMYKERDAIALGEVYSRHVKAMTAELLNCKADIAAELAHRDNVINDLCDAIVLLKFFIEGLVKSGKCQGELATVVLTIDHANAALSKAWGDK